MRKKELTGILLALMLGLCGCGNSGNNNSGSSSSGKWGKLGGTTEEATVTETEETTKTEADSTEEASVTTEASGTSEAAGSVTRYVLYEYEAGGQKMTNDILTQAGMEPSYLDLNADGTGKLTLFGADIDLTWTKDEIVVYGTTKYPYTIENDVLTLDMQGVIYTMNLDPTYTGSAQASTEKDDASATTEAASEAASTTETASSGEAPSGDGIVSEEKLQKGYVWLSKVNGNTFNTTYEELAAYYGVEGAFDKEEYSEKMEVNKRYYQWTSSEDSTHFIYVNFEEKEPGVYKVSGFNSSGFSASDAEAAYLDIVKEEAKEADKEAAANADMISNSHDFKEFGHKDNFVTVTYETPATGWSWDEQKENIVASDDVNSFGVGFISFDLYSDVEKVDAHKDSFENYQDIDDREIGGITMKGRTYKYIGYEWTEYYGSLADGRVISVGIVRIDLDEGTTGDLILKSVSFK